MINALALHNRASPELASSLVDQNPSYGFTSHPENGGRPASEDVTPLKPRNYDRLPWLQNECWCSPRTASPGRDWRWSAGLFTAIVPNILVAI